MPADTIQPESEPRRIDLKTVVATLRSGTATDEWLGRWLPATYEEPELFARTLYTFAGLRRGGLKSSPERVIDLYHDCVLSHLGQGRRALVVRNRDADTELGFDELHARSCSLLELWKRDSVQAGQCVCILLDVGVDYLVSLLTALRMGLVVCTLPAWGPTFLRNRVAALKPDFLIATPRQIADLGAAQTPVLATQAPRANGEGTHSYAPADPVLRVFSPFGDAELEPLDLPAAALHGALLRDGLLTWALDGTDTVAMPDFDPRTVQPTALLSTLISGACWSEFRATDFAKDPLLLKTHKVTLLGVRRDLANLVLASSKWPQGKLRAWFRNLTDSVDFSTASALGTLGNKASVASFNVAYCASLGGVLLAGAPNMDPLGLQAWPPAGQSFELGEVGGSALRALNDQGLYMPQRESKAVEGGPRLLLSRSSAVYQCAGTIDVGKDATRYPCDEVGQVVSAHPGIRHACVVVSPGSNINQARITLLAFVEETPAGTTDPLEVKAPDLLARVEREMGREFLPSRVEIFALRPRLLKGKIDTAWCRSQYLRGALTSKAKSEVFRVLSRLSYLFDVEPTAPQ